MKIAAFPNPSGSRYWRLEHPFRYLRKQGIEAIVCEEGITEEIAQWADIYVLQSCVNKEGIALLYAHQQEHSKKIVVDCDDSLTIDSDNPFKADHDAMDAPATIRKTIEIADLVTVTQGSLARQIESINKNVLVLPNYMDMDVWDKPRLPAVSDRVRIGWAGSMTHLEDLKMIVEPLKQIKRDYPQVDLIFCGDPRIAESFGDVKVETMLGVPFEVWPSRLNGMRLDIGLAPLRPTTFNKCRSNIKWLEYSINHVPGIYSPTAYNFPDFDGNLGQIAENDEQWYRNLENYVLHPWLRQEIGDHAYAWVRREFDLKRHVQKWVRAYTQLT